MNALIQRGSLLMGQGRFELAEHEFRQAIIEDPEAAAPRSFLAMCLSERERFDDAEREADAGVGLAPDWDFTHFAKAKVLLARNRLADAVVAAEEAIRLDPEDAHNHALLAAARLRQRRWQDALDAAEAGLALDPENSECGNIRALSLTHLGRREEGALGVADLLSRAPMDSLTHANAGWSCLHQGDMRQAMVHFQESLRLEPDQEWARQGMLTALKGRNAVYRWVLAYRLAMSRIKARYQWAIALGMLVVYNMLRAQAKTHPDQALWIWPLLAALIVACMLTWLADPLANLALRATRHGRMALSNDEIMDSTLVCACVALALGCLCLKPWVPLAAMFAWNFILVSVPVSSIYDCDPGWPRRMMAVASAVVAGMAIVIAVVLGDLGWLLMYGGMAGAFAIVVAGTMMKKFFLIAFAATLAAPFLTLATPKR